MTTEIQQEGGPTRPALIIERGGAMGSTEEKSPLNFRGQHSFRIDRDSVYVSDRPGPFCHYIGELRDVIASRSPLGEEFRAWWEDMRQRAELADDANDDSFRPRRLRVVR
jgi:hypothetical protein